jgi:hypothetical protein
MYIYQVEADIFRMSNFIETELGTATLTDLIYNKSSKCTPCLFLALRTDSVLKVNFLLAYIQEHFDKESLKEQLLWKSEQNENILTLFSCLQKLFVQF